MCFLNFKIFIDLFSGIYTLGNSLVIHSLSSLNTPALEPVKGEKLMSKTCRKRQFYRITAIQNMSCVKVLLYFAFVYSYILL